MANRTSTRNAQVVRFIIDTNANPGGGGAAITYTVSRAIEVIDYYSVQPPVAAGLGHNQIIWKNAAANVICAMAPGGVNNVLTRTTNLATANADLAAGEILGLQTDLAGAVGIRSYVTILPGVTATS